MSAVPDKAMWRLKPCASAKIESYPRISLRNKRFCSDSGPVVLDSSPEYDPMCGETAYHRQTFMAANCGSSNTVKSSEPSWVAAQGKDCACIVTWNKGNSKKRADFKRIFFVLFKEPEAAVSLQLGINEINAGNGRLGINEINVGNGRAASFVERNKIVVTSFVDELLMKKRDWSYHDTIKLAVSLFDQVFHGFVEADNIKIFVLKNGKEESVMTVEGETFLEESRKFYGEMRLSMNCSRSKKDSRKLYGKKLPKKDSRKFYGIMRHSMKRSASMKHSKK